MEVPKYSSKETALEFSAQLLLKERFLQEVMLIAQN
jgi:hypothetical protein